MTKGERGAHRLGGEQHLVLRVVVIRSLDARLHHLVARSDHDGGRTVGWFSRTTSGWEMTVEEKASRPRRKYVCSDAPAFMHERVHHSFSACPCRSHIDGESHGFSRRPPNSCSNLSKEEEREKVID